LTDTPAGWVGTVSENGQALCHFRFGTLFNAQVDFIERPLTVFCRLNQPTTMADLSEVELPTRFVLLVLSPEDDGPNVIWEISEMGRSIGSMLGDQVT